MITSINMKKELQLVSAASLGTETAFVGKRAQLGERAIGRGILQSTVGYFYVCVKSISGVTFLKC